MNHFGDLAIWGIILATSALLMLTAYGWLIEPWR
jgi:hypothetical protein